MCDNCMNTGTFRHTMYTCTCTAHLLEVAKQQSVWVKCRDHCTCTCTCIHVYILATRCSAATTICTTQYLVTLHFTESIPHRYSVSFLHQPAHTQEITCDPETSLNEYCKCEASSSLRCTWVHVNVYTCTLQLLHAHNARVLWAMPHVHVCIHTRRHCGW